MNKVLKRLNSAAGAAISRDISASVASLYEVKVPSGRKLRHSKGRVLSGEEADDQAEECDKEYQAYAEGAD